MAQKETKGMNLELGEDAYWVVFNHAAEMSKTKKRKVTLPEAAVNIIVDWGKIKNLNTAKIQ